MNTLALVIGYIVIFIFFTCIALLSILLVYLCVYRVFVAGSYLRFWLKALRHIGVTPSYKFIKSIVIFGLKANLAGDYIVGRWYGLFKGGYIYGDPYIRDTYKEQFEKIIKRYSLKDNGETGNIGYEY